MTDVGRRELPEGTWWLRLTLEPQAVDAPALQWAVFSEDPRRRFRADLRTLEDHLKKAEATDVERGPAWLLAGWNRLFRVIPGDRVYILTSASENALTTNEHGGHKWVATKAVRSGTAQYCWCIPFDATVGQIIEVTLGTQNRATLTDLAEGDGGR